MTDIEEALRWVPCGSHPDREPSECYYCAIDTLSDAYGSEVKRREAWQEYAGKLKSALKTANEWLSDDDPKWKPKQKAVKALSIPTPGAEDAKP